MVHSIKVVTITSLLTFFSMLCMAQDKAAEPVRQLEQYVSSHPQEKVFLHFDKPFYAISDDIWFKVYLVNASSHLPRKDALVYVQLLEENGNVVASRKIQVMDGGGFGDFELQALNLKEGNYVVRAYTSYMRNFDKSFFFHQQLKIVDHTREEVIAEAPSPTIAAQFFPEGGELVAGHVNHVGVKITTADGAGLNIAGTIVDEEGNELRSFQTEVFGMGRFLVKPQVEKPLFAQVVYESETYRFPLPDALSEGYLMSVRNKGGDIAVVARHSDDAKMAEAFIIVHQRGQFHGVLKANGKSVIHGTVKASQVESGIVTLTLFSGDGIPVRERIAFVDNMDKTQQRVAIETDKDVYGHREKVMLSLEDLQSDATLAGTASVSITNIALVPEDSRKSHLLSYLLLSSDIKGDIENPSYYFDPANKERLAHLDLLMMTQGWRRFTWNDVFNNDAASFSHQVEKGFWLEGQLTRFENDNKPVQGEVSLNVMEDLSYSQKVLSDENGYFYFRDVLVGDTVNMVVQARMPDKKKGADNVRIRMLPKDELKEEVPVFLKESNTIAVNEAFQEATAQIEEIDAAFRLENDVVLLGEFKVTAKRDITKDPLRRGEVRFGKPIKKIVADSVAFVNKSSHVFELLRRTAGIMVSGRYPELSLTMRGSSPIVLLDGNYVSNEVIKTLMVADISHIDIYKGPDAAILGIGSANGAVAIYTKNATQRNYRPRTGIINMKFCGFTVAREFYTPDYANPQDRHKKLDYRSTLYWNPSIDLSKGEPVEFFTSDEKGIYQVHFEGLTLDGKIINENRLIEVK